MPNKFIKITASYIPFTRVKTAKVSRKLSQCLQSVHRLLQISLGLKTTVQWERVRSQETAAMTPLKLWLQPQTDPVKSISAQRHRAKVLFAFLSGPPKKSWVGLDPHNHGILSQQQHKKRLKNKLEQCVCTPVFLW